MLTFNLRLTLISDSFTSKIYFVAWYAITVEITYGFNDNDFLHETPFILMTIFTRPVAGLSE